MRTALGFARFVASGVFAVWRLFSGAASRRVLIPVVDLCCLVAVPLEEGVVPDEVDLDVVFAGLEESVAIIVFVAFLGFTAVSDAAVSAQLAVYLLELKVLRAVGLQALLDVLLVLLRERFGALLDVE